MDLKTFLQSRLATVLLAGMLIFAMIVTAKLLIQKREVDKEITVLQNRADAVHNDNEQLSELIKYLDTPEYAERQAREKLNLKKDGEFVVVLPDDSNINQFNQAENVDSTPPYKKWFNYFFGQTLWNL